jgi:hypothetical protein
MIDLKLMRKRGYIIKLQGREYTTHAGLLATAHEHGLEGVWVDMVSWDADKRAAVMKATAKGERGTYSDYGDADPTNVGKNIATACIRMASTRASSRALRLYLGVGMTTFEELPGNSPAPAPKKEEPQPLTEPSTPVHHPSFEQDRPAFMRELGVIGWDYEEVCYYLDVKGNPRPSSMSNLNRNKLLSHLEGMDQVDRNNINKAWLQDTKGAPE